MAKSPCKSWLDFARIPIDWAALAAQRKLPTQKGDKRARWEVDRQQAAARRNKEAKQRAALERRLAAQKAARRSRRRLADGEARNVILIAMQPGQWYARPDLRNMTGLKYDTVKGLVAKFEKADFLERAKNPEWRPVSFKGLGVHLVLEREPRFLYRLTGLGEAARRAALAEASRQWLE